jgi:hypothetical protein
LPARTTSSPLARRHPRVGDVERHELREAQRRVQQQHHDRTVARPGILGSAHERALLVDRQRTRRGLRQRLARHDRRPQTEEAVEVIDRRKREIDGCRLPPLLDLEVALEVARGMIARSRLIQRRGRAVPSCQPATIRRDVTGVRLARSCRQRRALQILDVARDRVRNVVVGESALVSSRRFGGFRDGHDRISSRIGGRNRRLRCLPPSLLVLAFLPIIGPGRPMWRG